MGTVSGKPAGKKSKIRSDKATMGPENGIVPPTSALASAQKEEPVVAAGSATQAKDKPLSEKPGREKAKKVKLVRDSFAMPENEYEVLRALKKSCMKAGMDIKKSELLRVSVALLKERTPADIQSVLTGLIPLKAGRPKKGA